MGERAVKIGQKLESFGSTLFSDFHWDEVLRDMEIKCSRSTHRKQTHGLDLMCDFTDPYAETRQRIIIECKNRQMVSINQSNIEQWLAELQSSIECARTSAELIEYTTPNAALDSGLLLVHANDEYDHDKMQKYIRAASIQSKRKRMNLYIASNDQIDKWQSLLDYIKCQEGEFLFVYPSINGSNIREEKQITVNSLFSKYIFGQIIANEECCEEGGLPYKKPYRKRLVFCFDKICADAFLYIWSMFKHFQFPGSSNDKYVFVFYPSGVNDTEYVKNNFLKGISKDPHPIPSIDLGKIEVDFLTNRHLSPVDN